MKLIEKPQPGEYAPYAIMYIGLLPDDGLVLKYLKDNLKTTKDFILCCRALNRMIMHGIRTQMNGAGKVF